MAYLFEHYSCKYVIPIRTHWSIWGIALASGMLPPMTSKSFVWGWWKLFIIAYMLSFLNSAQEREDICTYASSYGCPLLMNSCLTATLGIIHTTLTIIVLEPKLFWHVQCAPSVVFWLQGWICRWQGLFKNEVQSEYLPISWSDTCTFNVLH